MIKNEIIIIVNLNAADKKKKQKKKKTETHQEQCPYEYLHVAGFFFLYFLFWGILLFFPDDGEMIKRRRSAF